MTFINRRSRKRGVFIRLFALSAAASLALLTCEKVPDYCGSGELYDPACQFCFAGAARDLCGGERYNPLTEGCAQNTVGVRCYDESVVPFGTPCGGYALTTSATPADGGSVKRSPDKPTYAAGEPVDVSAVPEGEYVFVGWAGADASTNTSVTITMNANKPLVAIFKPVDNPNAATRTLITTAFPKNGGSIVRNPNSETDTYNIGEAVTVTAKANPGYTFSGWSGAAVSKDTIVTVSMDESKTLVALFTPVVYTLTVNANPAEAGAVFVNGTALSGAASQDFGTEIEVWALAENGYVFKEWSGTAEFEEANNPNTKITLAADATITANFRRGDGGTGTPGGSGGVGGSGRFTDGRDGQTYRTVTIVYPMGSQTWMAENLNYETASGSWCYDNSPDSCAKYGRLYTWDAAMTVCPSGWHLASSLEWDILMIAVGGKSTAGKKLKSTSGWNNNGNGTDDFGFSALPGGLYYGSSFDYAGDFGFWWAATESSSGYAYYRGMYYYGGNVNEYNGGEGGGFSVRCVKD